ncbi:MAG: hypothetical protein LDL51_06140 [Chloroflexi bacterium]|nr:hypothetical protein [Chloroflexota bacterium]
MPNQSRAFSFKISPVHVIWIGAAFSALLLVLTLWIYFSAPLTEALTPFWKDKLLDALIFIPALGSAIAGTLLLNQFGTNETPRRIWTAFALGLWCWVGGEIAGVVNDFLYWDSVYPEFSVVDVLWLAGYFFLGLSLYYQLGLVYSKTRARRRVYLGLVALAILATASLTSLAERSGLGEGYAWIILFVTVLYPVLDAIQGTAAIWTSILFGRGQWSRPWWGLILFALADSVDTFYWLGGYESISPLAQTILNFVAVAA